MPVECPKGVDLGLCMYEHVRRGDERQYLIPSFVEWNDVSRDLMFEGLLDTFGEAICLQVFWGPKHLLDA